MKRDFDFNQLVELCQRTHNGTRRSAARAIDHSLVARNWLDECTIYGTLDRE